MFSRSLTRCLSKRILSTRTKPHPTLSYTTDQFKMRKSDNIDEVVQVAIKNKELLIYYDDIKDVLKSNPYGTYTVMRLNQKDSMIFDFSSHMERLSEGYKALIRNVIPDDDVVPAKYCQAHSMLLEMIGQMTTCWVKFRDANPLYHDDIRCCVLIHYDVKRDNNISIIVYMEKFPEIKTEPCSVLFSVQGRKHAHLKDSRWQVEKNRMFGNIHNSQNVEEIIMFRDTGECLEGMSSNFFSIINEETLHTAGDDVLMGTMRSLVIDAAKDIGLKVVENGSSVLDYRNWTGCGISSTSRMFLPIGDILESSCFDENLSEPLTKDGLPAHSFNYTEDSAAIRLQKKVMELYPKYLEKF